MYFYQEIGGSAASVRRLAPLQNSSGQAYKPKVAIAQNHLKEKNSTLAPINNNNQLQKSHATSASAKFNGAAAPQYIAGDRKGGHFIFYRFLNFKLFFKYIWYI